MLDKFLFSEATPNDTGKILSIYFTSKEPLEESYKTFFETVTGKPFLTSCKESDVDPKTVICLTLCVDILTKDNTIAGLTLSPTADQEDVIIDFDLCPIINETESILAWLRSFRTHHPFPDTIPEILDFIKEKE